MSDTPTHDDTAPEVDALGYAATRIVRVRRSPASRIIRFYRVWMKPGNLAFPPQEREITDHAERIAQLAKYLDQQHRSPGRCVEIRMVVTPPPGTGVCPNFSEAPQQEVGVSPGDAHTHEGVKISDETPEEDPAEHVCPDCGALYDGNLCRACCEEEQAALA